MHERRDLRASVSSDIALDAAPTSMYGHECATAGSEEWMNALSAEPYLSVFVTVGAWSIFVAANHLKQLVSRDGERAMASMKLGRARDGVLTVDVHNEMERLLMEGRVMARTRTGPWRCRGWITRVSA
ncbi:MAG TPA: hypothetical protein VK506_07975, partial [Conexibacter sp.]|nr:hypothetical protein [Conexibacter sp.]